MPLPTSFANNTTPTGPQLDGNFAALGDIALIPCTVSGANNLVLTPLANTPTISAYQNGNVFTGIAAQTNTGAMTAQVGSLPALAVFKDVVAGTIPLTGGENVVGGAFQLVYDSTLSSGNGGFHIKGQSGGTGNIAAPTARAFVSGSGTYTTPVGATYIEVIAMGGGGGGGGGGTTPGNGGNGGNTTFGSTLVASGGSGGHGGTGGLGGLGGTTGGGYVLVNGGVGQNALGNNGANGGNGAFGGGGPGAINEAGSSAGVAGAENSGAGGGGGSNPSSANGGAGGGAGGYVMALVSSPAPTYAYSVGSAGAGGSAGTGGGGPGGAGGNGQIAIQEHYGA